MGEKCSKKVPALDRPFKFVVSIHCFMEKLMLHELVIFAVFLKEFFSDRGRIGRVK